MKFQELDWCIIIGEIINHKFEIGEKVLIIEVFEKEGYYLASNGANQYAVKDEELKLYEE